MAVNNATILDKVRIKGTDDYQQRIPSPRDRQKSRMPSSA